MLFLDKEFGEKHTLLCREAPRWARESDFLPMRGTFAEGSLSTQLPAIFASTAPLWAEDSLLSLALLA